MKLVKTVPPEKRLTANFLSNVEVGDPSDSLSVRSVEEVQRYTDVLAYCNAATAVMKSYHDLGQPVSTRGQEEHTSTPRYFCHAVQ